MIRDLGDELRRREAKDARSGGVGEVTQETLSLLMLLAWPVSTDPPLQATVRAEKDKEGVSSPHHASCGVRQLQQDKEQWAGR